MVLNVHRKHKAILVTGKKGKWGKREIILVGRYYLYTVTTRMTPAQRWAAMRAILMLH